jgi:hypothetical protein
MRCIYGLLPWVWWCGIDDQPIAFFQETEQAHGGWSRPDYRLKCT